MTVLPLKKSSALCASAAQAAGATHFSYRGRTADPFLAPERITVCEAFQRHAGVDLAKVKGINIFEVIKDSPAALKLDILNLIRH